MYSGIQITDVQNATEISCSVIRDTTWDKLIHCISFGQVNVVNFLPDRISWTESFCSLILVPKFSMKLEIPNAFFVTVWNEFSGANADNQQILPEPTLYKND